MSLIEAMRRARHEECYGECACQRLILEWTAQLERLHDEMRAAAPLKAAGDVSATQVHQWADRLK